VVVLVLFGGTKIPQLARGFGEGIREFKKSINGDDSESTTTPKNEADAAVK
jgi:sec-independent protein translocase protein TatA